jgi:hypothetical protein
MLLGVTFPNVVVVSLIVTLVIGLFGALFTNIGLEVEKNKTDNDTFFDAVIPMDGEIFIPQRKPLHD